MRLRVRQTLLPLLLACLVPAVLAFAEPAGDELGKSREQLHDIEQRLEQTLSDLEQKKSIENDVLDDLQQVDHRLARLQKKVAHEKSALRELNNTVAAEQQELEKSRQEVAQLQGQVQQRLVALYKSEEAGVLKTLFSAHDIAQLLEDYDYLGRVVSHDRDLLERFRQRVQSRQESLARLAESRRRQQQVTQGLKEQEERLTRTAHLKKRYLAAVRKDRAALDRAADDLKARAEALTDLITDLERDGRPKSGDVSLFELQKGLLPWPVDGTIKTAFGKHRHAELGTLLENHGIEILAKPESGVRAVWDGRVVFAKRFKGYGNLIIIDHDDGYYTLYAQVDAVLKKADDRVKKGELIAYSGFEGADHVYFEVRKGRTPIDPEVWIEKR